MAFNPFKNRQLSEPEIKEENLKEEVIEADETLVTYNPNYLQQVSSNNSESIEEPSYEGKDINDLAYSGLDVKSILDNDSILVNEKDNEPTQEVELIDTSLLETLPLPFVLEKFNAEKIQNNKYKLLDQIINIKEDKWYNQNYKRGNVKALSLAKHLITISHHYQNNDINNLNKIPFFDNNLIEKTQIFLSGIYSEYTTLKEQKKEEIKKQYANNGTSEISKEIVYHKANKPKELTQEEKFHRYRQITDDLNNISLNLVMEHIGANPNEDKTPGKWKVWSTGDNIAITGQRWYSWKGQTGGVGAISLLAFHLSYLNNVDHRVESNKKALWKMARNQLIEVFGIGDLADLASSNDQIIFKVPFAMPLRLEGKINQVKNYLHEKRKIPLWIINKQIEQKTLFAGFPSDWKEQPKNINDENFPDDKVWATFLSSNSTAAEMRAIARSDNLAKLLAKGSDKELGGFAIKAEKDVNERTISTLEAAVDTLSYHAFYPGRIATSCMGVTHNLAVKVALQALSRDYNFQLCFDNDQAGNEAAIRFREGIIMALGEEILIEKEEEDESYIINDPDKRSEEIFRLGIEKYQQLYNLGKIKYYDLGLLCLEECIKTNQVFYLDVQDNPIGMDVVRLFHTQANKLLGNKTVQELIKKGQIKYVNTCPVFEMMENPAQEAQHVFDKLNDEAKPYYLRIKESDNENDINKQENPNKRSLENKKLFEEAFVKIAGKKYDEWIKNGKIIHTKKAIAKDWNEFFIYKQTHDLKFRERIKQQEEHYSHYSNNNQAQENHTKKKRP